MGVAFHYADKPATQWRGPLGMGLIWPALMIVVALLSPESPRWLLLKGRAEEAKAVTYRLHGSSSDHEFADQEFKDMTAQVSIDSKLESSWVSRPQTVHASFQHHRTDTRAVVNVCQALVSQASSDHLLVVLCWTVDR